MADVTIRNESSVLKCLSTEGMGEDYWMKPGEEILVGLQGISGRTPLVVEIQNDGIVLGVDSVAFDVRDSTGRVLQSGYQRPPPSLG
jgi:hypothetical protein